MPLRPVHPTGPTHPHDRPLPEERRLQLLLNWPARLAAVEIRRDPSCYDIIRSLRSPVRMALVIATMLVRFQSRSIGEREPE